MMEKYNSNRALEINQNENALLLCGYAYTKNVYQKLITSAPDNWNFHSLEFEKILLKGVTATFHETIKDYLAKQNIDLVTPVAHSLGGIYAIDFAYYYPDLVKQLYLINIAGINNETSLLRFLAQILQGKRVNFLKSPQRQIAALNNVLTKPVNHLRLLQYARKINIEGKAEKITVPTTIFWGGDDRLFNKANGEKLHKLIPDSKLIFLEGMDHDWPIHSPELFWKNIK